jgi:O-antigen/teichoic acid export membrane protein
VLGKAALMAANTALLLFLASRLPLAVYGLFVAVAGAQVILSRAVLAGTDGGVVRLSSAAGGFARPECIGAGVVILRRTAMTAVICAAVAALLPLPWPIWIAPVVAAGGIGVALVDYGYYCRLARLDYRAASAVQCAMGGLRLAAVIAVNLAWPAQPVAVFLAYAAGSLTAGLVQFRAAARDASRPAAATVRRLFQYSVWQGTASVVATGALHVGTFVFLALQLKDAAGVFALGLSLSLPFFFLYNAYFEFLLPRMSRAPDTRALRRTVLAWTGVALALAAACVPVAAAAGFIFPRLFRPELAAAVPVFYWLAASNALLLVQAVFEAASHSLLRPVYVTATWTVRLSATAVAVFALARGGDAGRGGMGQFLAALIALAVISVLVTHDIRRRNARAEVAVRTA